MSAVSYVATAALNVLWLLLGDRLSVYQQMAVPLLSALLVAIGVLFRTRGMSRGERRAYWRGVLWIGLAYYVAILAVLLFYGGLFHVDRAWGGAVNLEPLYSIRRFWLHYRRTGSLSSLLNLLGNVVIFIPLGVLLPTLFRAMRRVWLFVPLLAAVCAGVEWLQWHSGLGVADVDDSILNVAGAVIGWTVTRLVQLVYFHFKGARK